MNNINFFWHNSISGVPKECLELLLGDCNIPFYNWSWLGALEKSGSVSLKNGWQPIHLSVWRNKKPIAIAPLYIKNHSYGEFIFDQAFAQLAKDLGLNYYPKLIGMSPFSPVEGYRFFFAKGEEHEELTKIMIEKIDQFAIRNGIISCNFLYVENNWGSLDALSNHAKWINRGSVWLKGNAVNFNSYLQRFNSRQSRNIKKERASLTNHGIKISAISGNSINPKILFNMYKFYENHCSKWGVWGSKYLSESFFQELANPLLRKNLVTFIATLDNEREPLAMSFCIKHKNMLWGRYWGCRKEIKNLHFEMCYYTPISWAIQNHVDYFDPGAGGEHKQRRGFKSKSHYSLHRWYEPRMNALIRAWLPKSNNMMIQEIEKINNELPFKIIEGS